MYDFDSEPQGENISKKEAIPYHNIMELLVL